MPRTPASWPAWLATAFGCTASLRATVPDVEWPRAGAMVIGVNLVTVLLVVVHAVLTLEGK